MYAKFVLYWKDSEGMTPYSNVIIEGDKFKYRCLEIKSPDEIVEKYHVADYDLLNGFCNKKEPEEPEEIIFLKIFNKGMVEHVVAGRNSSLFIMNNEGKTIDKVRCTN
jgi:hypothetical protein